MKRLLLAIVLTFLASAAAAQEIHTPHCLFGCPKGTPASNNLIVREIYTLSSNDATKLADWVAYKVTKVTIGPSKDRNWKADPLLDDEETLEPADYRDARAALKVDRGHQAPLASFTGTPHWAATNYLSNITPQASALNQGPWERLESKERQVAKQQAVYVMTGPVYLREVDPLPHADEAHRVPSGYWKIVAVQANGSVNVAAFFFDQETPGTARFCDHLTTVHEVEQKSGLDFFWFLPDDVEEKIEAGQRGATLARDHLGC